MKKLLALTISAAVATAGAQTYSSGLSGVELGLTGGYAGGLSGEAFVHVPNVAGPIGIKAGVSLTKAADAINDASPADPSGLNLIPGTFGDQKAQGNASESGSRTVVSLDGTYNLGEVSPGVGTMLYAGGRYGMFRSTEDFGSNGSTTYSTSAFGVGAGVMVSYALSGNLSLVGDLGIDQFFTSGSTINIASSNGNNDSITSGDAAYSSTSSRFVRPGTVLKARIGLKTSY